MSKYAHMFPTECRPPEFAILLGTISWVPNEIQQDLPLYKNGEEDASGRKLVHHPEVL